MTLSEHLASRVSQIEDLKAAVRAADHDDFADDEETAAVFARYAAGEVADRVAADKS